MNKKYLLLTFIGLGCLIGQAYANTGTLEKIKAACEKSRKDCIISLGVRESSIPFNYKLNNDEYTGYSYEIAKHIVHATEKKLGVTGLTIKNIPITSQNRISLIQNGTIDIECGSTTNNTDRQKQVDFTNTIFIIGTQLLTHKNSGIKDFSDLKNRKVVTMAGTTSERILKKLNSDHDMKMDIISTQELSSAFLTLQSKRADAFMMDDALLYGERAKAAKPNDWVVVGTPQSYEAYGCMVRKGDDEFKRLADDTIAHMMKSGDAEKLYDKWFMGHIPPNNKSLDFPLSKHMQELFENPNDKAIE